MRTKNVIGVLENLKHDKCGYEIMAINQAIYCVQQMKWLETMTKKYRKMEKEGNDVEYVDTMCETNPLGFNLYQVIRNSEV